MPKPKALPYTWCYTRMRAIIQRVNQAAVTVDGTIVGQIQQGLLVLLGVGQNDGEPEAQLLAEKIVQMRIFSDSDGKFNMSIVDVGGAILAVSQFTLYADTRRGRRPSFSNAARPELALPLFEHFCAAVRNFGLQVETGVFGAHMDVALVNDGPVTIILDSDKFSEPRT